MAKKTDATEDQILEDAGAEPRVYELGFHLDPELPQEEVKKAYQEIRNRISGAGTIVAEGEPVKIPLAYTISRMDTTGRRDFSSAFFCWIAYEVDATAHAAITEAVAEDTRVIRSLDLRSSVDAAKHSADMQELFAEQATAAQTLEDDALEAEAEAEAAAAVPAPVVEEEAA